MEALSKATRLGLKHPGADPYKPRPPLLSLASGMNRGGAIKCTIVAIANISKSQNILFSFSFKNFGLKLSS